MTGFTEPCVNAGFLPALISTVSNFLRRHYSCFAFCQKFHAVHGGGDAHPIQVITYGEYGVDVLPAFCSPATADRAVTLRRLQASNAIPAAVFKTR